MNRSSVQVGMTATLVGVFMALSSGCASLQALYSHDQGTLSRIAIHSRDNDARTWAVQRMTDQALIGRVALESWSTATREECIKKLQDQDALGTVVLREPQDYLKSMALAKVTNQVMLGRIALQVKTPEVLAAAVSRLSNQVILAQIAREEGDLRVRLAAAEGLEDQATLAVLAGASAVELRRVAAKKLTDAKRLARMVREDSDPSTRYTALANITDRDLLKASVGNDPYAPDFMDIRLFLMEPAIANKLGDTRIAVWFRPEGSYPLKQYIIWSDGRTTVIPDIQVCITGPGLPRPVILHACIPGEMTELLDGFSDAELAGLLKACEPASLVHQVVEARRAQEAALIKEATEQPISLMRANAVQRLNDPTVLRRIAEKDESELVRREARSRLEALEGQRKP